jgi:hypothetical protein
MTTKNFKIMITTKIQTGYQVQQLGSFYCVVYVFADGEAIVMRNKYFKTISGAEKAMQKIKMMAGAL